MRKSWLLIALSLAAIVLVACGSETETATVAPTSAQPAPTQVPAPTEASTTAPANAPTLAPTATAVPTATPVEQRMEGLVLEALERNSVEIELLQVQDDDGRVWDFVTEGPIGIDAAHLLTHLALGQGVEVVYLEKDGRLIALQVNDLFTQ